MPQQYSNQLDVTIEVQEDFPRNEWTGQFVSRPSTFSFARPLVVPEHYELGAFRDLREAVDAIALFVEFELGDGWLDDVRFDYQEDGVQGDGIYVFLIVSR